MTQPHTHTDTLPKPDFNLSITPEEVAYYTSEAYKIRNQVVSDAISGAVNFVRKSVSDLHQIFAVTGASSH